MKEEIYNFFKSICSLQGSGRASAYTFRKNADMVASIYETFNLIEKKYFKEFPVESNFKKLVDFNYTYFILYNFCVDDSLRPFDDDGGMYDYEENKMGKYNKLAMESLVSKGVYFPTFSNEEDDDNFASYNLDLVKKSFKILETEFKDLIEFSQYHVDFIVKNGLRFEIKNSCYDENLVDGFEEFNIWVYKFSNQWDFKDHNTIEGLDDGGNEVWNSVHEAIVDLADRPALDEDGIPLTKYCDEGTQNFNSMIFLDKHFNF